MSCIVIIVVIILIIAFGMIACQRTENFGNISVKRAPVKFAHKNPTGPDLENQLYSPFLMRPPDIVAPKYGGRCTNELYPEATSSEGKGEMASPCNVDIEGRYYGMRPILSPDTTNAMIKGLFDKIVNDAVSIPNVDQSELKYQNQFCDANSYSDVMKYVLKQINETQAKMPDFRRFAKSDTWGGDMFAFLNEEIIMMTEMNPDKFTEQAQAVRARKKNKHDTKYILTFTLYLPLRSLSLDTTAIIIRHRGKLHIVYMDFSTNKSTDGGLQSANISPGKTGGIHAEGGISSTPEWIYGNQIENQTFNLKGFHDPDPSNNILIPGGIPEEYNQLLEKCDQAYLMDPSGGAGPRFKGGYQSDNQDLSSPIYPNFPNTDTKWVAHT